MCRGSGGRKRLRGLCARGEGRGEGQAPRRAYTRPPANPSPPAAAQREVSAAVEAPAPHKLHRRGQQALGHLVEGEAPDLDGQRKQGAGERKWFRHCKLRTGRCVPCCRARARAASPRPQEHGRRICRGAPSSGTASRCRARAGRPWQLLRGAGRQTGREARAWGAGERRGTRGRQGRAGHMLRNRTACRAAEFCRCKATLPSCLKLPSRLCHKTKRSLRKTGSVSSAAARNWRHHCAVSLRLLSTKSAAVGRRGFETWGWAGSLEGV